MHSEGIRERQGGKGLAALRRFGAKAPEREVCSLCSSVIGEDHEHLVDPGKRQIVCACTPCAILFSSRSATAFKRVPRDVTLLDGLSMGHGRWDALEIPIGLAFFYRDSVTARVFAIYPSPAGPMESTLDMTSWEIIGVETPAIGRMQEDTEALLVNRMEGRDIALVVPIDVCYQLVGIVRTHWQGMSGGATLNEKVAAFFDALIARARPSREVTRA